MGGVHPRGAPGSRGVNPPAILYLSPDMKSYGGAMYQHDVMDELSRQARVHFHGPGFPGYRRHDTLDDAIAKGGFTPDVGVAGHAFLNDGDGAIERFPGIDLRRRSLPRFILLNKEYARLDDKLAFIRSTGFDGVFSHHHDAERYADRAGCPVRFWPFGADHRLFRPSRAGKRHDLGFSGILQNPTPGRQSDLRARLLHEFFHCLGDVPVLPRHRHRHLRVVFNALPRSTFSNWVNDRLGVYRRLTNDDYAELIRSCSAYINTRSPADLVSPRCVECMLSGTVVLSERNAAHARIFPPDAVLEFDDVPDFLDALPEAMRRAADPAWVARTRAAALEHHTWHRRIADLLAVVAGTQQRAVATVAAA
jgi:glycosyltransferase involved in cell wall biosynthesis